MLWFECEMPSIGMEIKQSQLVVLFQKALEPLGGGASLEEVSHWGGAGTEVLIA